METSFGITIQATPMPSFVKYIIKFFEFFNHVIMTSQITQFVHKIPILCMSLRENGTRYKVE